jgi:asparagine synthase (glutamine-hydrolysing)
MCGIAGILSRQPLQPEQVDRVARMNALLAHRGPDGAGEFHDDRVALAMRRLSIIDLSTGWQPLYNEEKSLVLVCNGEIYNFIELRAHLERHGHRFATKSDCETILHLYEDHGDDCVTHLRGMFAFALWDTRRRRLLLARDRMGEKPLYLACTDRSITFASELKALVHSEVVPFELDPNAVNLYFHYGYVPEPFAAVKDVRKLPAAHIMTVDVDSWRIDERCYWRMEDAPPLEGDPAKTVREELDRIAELIIRSDVPVGIALSSGLDSSAIACLTAKRYPGTMQAISVGYVGRPIQDEREDARSLAKHLGMPFHEVELSPQDLIDLLRSMPYERDDPFADTSGVSYYAVLRKARELNVPVMLSGHGGDELFWGYRWVREAVHATRRKQALRNGGHVGLKEYLKFNRPPYSYTAGMRWLKSMGGLRSGWKQFQRDRVSPHDRMVFYDLEHAFSSAAERAGGFYSPRFRQSINPDAPFDFFTIPHPWPPIDITITRLISQTYMLENGLAQGDRLSMATSVELRLPLVDFRLVETVIGLRKTYEDIDLPPKHWFREAIKDVVPPFVLNKRKRGFSTPWRHWSKALSEAFGAHLEDGYLVEKGVLDPSAAKYLSKRISPPPLGLPMPFADYALMLEVWCRQMQGSREGARS